MDGDITIRYIHMQIEMIILTVFMLLLAVSLHVQPKGNAFLTAYRPSSTKILRVNIKLFTS